MGVWSFMCRICLCNFLSTSIERCAAVITGSGTGSGSMVRSTPDWLSPSKPERQNIEPKEDQLVWLNALLSSKERAKLFTGVKEKKELKQL